MKKIPFSQIKTGQAFDKPVYIDGKDLLLGAYEPLKIADYERLKKWGIDSLYTDGRPLEPEEVEKELQDVVLDIADKTPDVSDLYYISSTNYQEIEAAKAHQEMIDVVKNNFDLARHGKMLDIESLRNAANSALTMISKNRRIIFKLVLISPTQGQDFVYYQAVNTTLLTIMTGLNLKYSKLQLLNLALGALLHDIGSVRIPDSIMHKKEALSELEVKTLRTHPVQGHKIIEYTNSFSSDVSQIVLQHHERLDGSGYPYGLQGRQIGEYPRLVAICDTYQAMCHRRDYREAKSPPLIIKTLLKEGIGKLDPNLLKIFAFTSGVYPVGLLVALNNGDVGEVMLQNIKALTKPVIKIYLTGKNEILKAPKVINLASEADLKIERVLSNDERKQILRQLGGK